MVRFISTVCSLMCLTAALSAQSLVRQIPVAGTGTFTASTGDTLNTGGPELDPGFATLPNNDSGNDATGRITINRSIRKSPNGSHVSASSLKHAKSNPVLNLSFDGLNFYQQRYANNGNQFSVEPPDQGLCAGNGFVLESVNDVLRVFSTGGNTVTGVVSLNQFYGYIPAINRTTGAYGPSVTDPSCYFDQDSQRWFQIALTLDRIGTSSKLSGKNHLDIAVSQTSSPLGTWNIYRLPVQDDGTQGTPNHSCPGGPCLGDYPHIGADSNGVYITTNEFPFFASGYNGSQIYAISKQALASGASSITVVQYNTGDPSTPTASGLPGFTVWPTISAGPSPAEFGGTEYFLMSLAVFADSGIDSRLQLWSLTNTSALNSGGAPALTSSLVNTEAYAVPGFARQPGVGTNGVGQAPGGGNIDFPPASASTFLPAPPPWPTCLPSLTPSPKPSTRWTATIRACSRSTTPTASSGARSEPASPSARPRSAMAWPTSSSIPRPPA